MIGPLSASYLANRIKEAHPGEMGRILDFGCGTGRLHEGLRPTGYYVGVDICARYLNTFRMRSPKVFLVQVKHFEIPLPQNDFDTVLCYSVFTHMEPKQIQLILNEFNRVLRPGGIALVSIFELEGIGHTHVNNWVAIAREKFIALCGEAHFTVKGTEDVADTKGFHQTLYILENQE